MFTTFGRGCFDAEVVERTAALFAPPAMAPAIRLTRPGGSGPVEGDRGAPEGAVSGLASREEGGFVAALGRKSDDDGRGPSAGAAETFVGT